MAKILIIEDDQALAQTYADVLSTAGYTSEICYDGLEALRKLEHEVFDLIITDLNLPKVPGQQFIEILQEKSNKLPCPIIISSGFINNNVINSFGGHGLIHFLPKPASNTELVNKAKELLSKTAVKAKIDVRFINPILNSTIDTILTMTQLQAIPAKPYLKKIKEISGDISSVVGVVGSGFKGTISISFTDAGFLIIVSKMLSENITEITEENKDAIAELLNVIFGNAKRVLNESGLNIQPAIPTIIRGKDHSIAHRNQSQTIVIPFSCKDIGEFRVEVSSMG